MLKISKFGTWLHANDDVHDDQMQSCPPPPIKASKTETLCENLLDSGVVGGIAWISQVVATQGDLSAVSFLIGFGLTFLIKLKEYRKIA